MKLPRWTFTTLLALILTGTAASAWGADSTAERIALKAARGVDNAVLGLVAEWPKTTYYQSKAHGLPYGMTVGAVQGVSVGLTRTGVGLYELATFPLPVPAGYQPILSPEFSFEPQETRIAQEHRTSAPHGSTWRRCPVDPSHLTWPSLTRPRERGSRAVPSAAKELRDAS